MAIFILALTVLIFRSGERIALIYSSIFFIFYFMIFSQKYFKTLIAFITILTLTFIIIGIGKGLYYNKIKNKINNSNNVILLDNMSRSEIINKYYKASLLLHAAKAEGFPNVFLESFAQGVPVVSIKLDPDNVINNNQLGFVVNNKVECKEIINKITGSNSLRKKMGENAINYIKSNHLPEIIKVEYLKLFKYV